MRIFFFFVVICAITAQAQLTVTVAPPKIANQKTVVELKMKNGFAANIESARAICFLLDDQGKLTFPIWFLAHDQRGPFS
jgi:hypothetical protein